jgi:GNAT superfamily N-acetyltransferase
MPELRVEALSDAHREECGALLAERFARQRAAEKLLPEVGDFAAHLPSTEGMVATRGGRVVAYVAGEVTDGVARCGFAGCAASEPEAIRDCFAALATEWGTSRFAVAVPASDGNLVDAWFRLAFGCQFVWGVRETAPAEPVDFGGLVRHATRDDLDALAGFDKLLWDFQAGPPSFSGITTPPLDELRAEWLETFDEAERYAPFVAERDGRVVGHLLLYRRPTGDLRVPESNLDLADAATLAAVRGTGVGLALVAHALRHAHEQGFRSLTVDWRSVNLLSSRFWPARGFRPQYLRLYRAVP